MNHPLVKYTFYYLIYTLLVVLLHLASISMIAYFHFLLDHRLVDVEDWIYHHQWEIVGISKIIAGFLVFRLLSIQSEYRNPFQELIKKGQRFWNKEAVVIITSLFLVTLLIGKPVKSGNDFFLMRFLSSFIGNLVFFMSDIWIVYFLFQIYPSQRKSKYFVTFVFPLITFFVTKYWILYGRNIHSSIVFYLGVGYLFSWFWDKENWGIPAIFTLFFICPFNSLFGLDPIWHSVYSPFIFIDGITKFEYFSMIVMIAVYLLIKSGFGKLKRSN